MNKIDLIGRLTKDVELRKTQSNLSVVNFTIAVDDPYKPKDDEQKTDFINCVAWKNQADILNNYTKKGSFIGLSGALKQRSYDKSDGSKVSTYEVVCSSVYLVEKKSDTQTTEAPKKSGYRDFDKEIDDSFSKSLDITDDHLPF